MERSYKEPSHTPEGQIDDDDVYITIRDILK